MTKKLIKKNEINYMSNRMAMIIRLIVGLIRKMLFCKMSQYFPKPCERFGRSVKVELSSSYYVTKACLKGQHVLIHLI